MILSFSMKANLTELEAIRHSTDTVSKTLMAQVMADTSPYVPFLTGSLDQRTHIVGDTIVYPGPYARYLYFGKAMVDSITGKGPAYIPEVGYRFRRGATLKPTNRGLNYTKTFHPKATAYWFEVSKAQNLRRWLETARKAITNG